MSQFSLQGNDLLSLFKKIAAGYKVEVVPASTPENQHPLPCHRFYVTEQEHVVIYRPANLDGGE